MNIAPFMGTSCVPVPVERSMPMTAVKEEAGGTPPAGGDGDRRRVGKDRPGGRCVRHGPVALRGPPRAGPGSSAARGAAPGGARDAGAVPAGGEAAARGGSGNGLGGTLRRGGRMDRPGGHAGPADRSRRRQPLEGGGGCGQGGRGVDGGRRRGPTGGSGACTAAGGAGDDPRAGGGGGQDDLAACAGSCARRRPRPPSPGADGR